MPYILVEDFKGGLDTRRTNVTSVPGSLATLTNAHISRGGEIEKRKAFVELATLPADSSGDPQTVGLAAGGGQIYVFGSDPSSSVTFAAGTPSNINYIQLRHPEAEGSFRVTSDAGSGSVTNIVVDSVEILGATVSSAGTQALTAEAIAEQINDYVSFNETPDPDDPEYIATSDGDKVIIRGAIAEATSMTITTTSGVTVGDKVDFKSIKMTKLLGVDFFDGDVYSSALFADGKIYHYWEGQDDINVTPPNRIADWFDGRARSRFNITGGTAGGTAATGTVTITGGTDNPGDNIRLTRVNGVQIQENSVVHTGDNDTTATAVAAAINATTSSPNYTASATTNVVTITAGEVGVSYNGYVVAVEVDGAATGSTANMSGGIDNAITEITVDGKTIIGNPVKWATSNTDTATLVAKEINDHQAAPEIEATTDGSIVNIIARNSGTALNSKTVAVTAAGTVTYDQYGLGTMDGGVTDTSVGGFTPGSYVMTVKDKMHSVSGSVWHHSDLDNPKEWNSFTLVFEDTEKTIVSSGACFAGDLSNSASGSQDLNALANYFQNVAVFAEQAIQIWFVDPNPAKLQQVQVLTNTGTIAPLSVVEFGDSDVFYLDISGIRSLQSRDSSNAAFVEDIGNAIDELIQQELIADENAVRDAAGILSPRDGRYMLAIGTKIYVFSYYPSSKVSAWSIYEPGFTVQNWSYDGNQILCRGDDNKLYSLGGSNNNTYDSSTVTVQLPFLDGSKPATFKDFTGLDATVENDWSVSIATDPTDISITEDAGIINKTTYGLLRASITGYSTHLALKLVCTKAGSAKIGNIAVHYEISEAT